MPSRDRRRCQKSPQGRHDIVRRRDDIVGNVESRLLKVVTMSIWFHIVGDVESRLLRVVTTLYDVVSHRARRAKSPLESRHDVIRQRHDIIKSMEQSLWELSPQMGPAHMSPYGQFGPT
jgi:hypothetical protein